MPATRDRPSGDGLGRRGWNERREPVPGASPAVISWCLTGAVFWALAEIGGLDEYRDLEAGMVDSVNFCWALVTPLFRVLAGRGYGHHVLVWNDRACGGPEALLREAATVSAPRP